MPDLICVTNRALCKENFLERIEKLAEAKPEAIILREKDLPPEEYLRLSSRALEICKRQGVQLILHSFADVARKLNIKAIHLPMPKLRTLTEEEREYFSVLGASCHSVAEAVEAEKLGCTYIIAGHIFNTDCKKGLLGRGTEFLKEVAASVKIPVYAIGGITFKNYAEVLKAGAKGACVMSGAMTCPDIKEYFGAFNYEI